MNAPAQTAFSFSQVWDDAFAMLRANAGLLTAIAGVFLFLPALVVALYVPPPETAESPAEWIEQFRLYNEANWPWLLVSGLVNMIGVIAIYLLLLAAPRMTVGGAVVAALTIVPFYFLMTLGLNIAVGIGFVLLIVPGVYLLGRLVLTSPVLVAELPRSPGGAFRRAWELSKGRAWQIALMVLLVYIVAGLASFAVGTGIGVVVLLLLGNEGVGGFIVAVLEALVGAAVTVVATVLIAAIYRAVTSRPDLGKSFN
jgi:hypothetical protein